MKTKKTRAAPENSGTARACKKDYYPVNLPAGSFP